MFAISIGFAIGPTAWASSEAARPSQNCAPRQNPVVADRRIATALLTFHADTELSMSGITLIGMVARCTTHGIVDRKPRVKIQLSTEFMLGNLATLLDVSPRALTDWFWFAYVDAYDWVVEPNVLAMATFGAGELMTTKPYVAGSAYIHRMSDYCGGSDLTPRPRAPSRGSTGRSWGATRRT